MQNKEKSFSGIVPRKQNALAIRAREDDEPIITRAFRASLSGLASFVVTGLVFISCAAAIAFTRADPDSLITPLALAALFPATFTGGFTTVRKMGNAPLLCGVLCGGIITLFTIIAALFLRGTQGSGYELWQSSILHGATILFSIFGAFAGNVKKKIDPRKHRRFR